MSKVGHFRPRPAGLVHRLLPLRPKSGYSRSASVYEFMPSVPGPFHGMLVHEAERRAMEELLKLLGFTTPFMYAAAAYGFFHWLDENASDEAKAALARTMRFKDHKNEQIASALVEVFDRIYTYPLLRWRPFRRSLLFTTVVSAICLFELYLLNSPNFRGVYRLILLLGFLNVLIFWLFNVFTDYLSLFVIRPLLVRSGTKPVMGLALGAMSGVAIVFAAFIVRFINVANFLLEYILFQNLNEQERSMFEFMPGSQFAYGVNLMWPAMLVFAWLPLFALGILAARLLTPLSWIVGRTQWFLKEGKEHPLKAIGYVAGVAVFVGTVAGRAVFSA